MWVHGDTATNSPTVFGTQGVPSSTSWPQSTYGSAFWTDTAGNFWMYGGNSNYCDMWMFDPVTIQWTWVHGPGVVSPPAVTGTLGVPSAANLPGTMALGTATWTDHSNNLWMFHNGYMWKFDPNIAQWAYYHLSTGPVHGTRQVFSSTNSPGARLETECTWVDKNGDLWLFGGSVALFGMANDLWKYDISTNQWAWWSGSNVGNVTGNYGTKGVPAATNVPGGRFVYMNWYDSQNDKFYLFGGANGIFSPPFSDMWEYDITADMWTWVSGTSTPGSGQYGTQCVGDANNYPPGRFENKQEFVDECGNFYGMAGGTFTSGAFNDLWRYEPSTLKWTWMSGIQGGNTQYNYGVQGVPSSSNFPPSTMGSPGWKDKEGNFWVYNGHSKYSSALMKYIPDPIVPDFGFAVGDTCGEIDFSDSSATGCNVVKSYAWDFGDGGVSNDQNPRHFYSQGGNYPVTLIIRGCSGRQDTVTKTVNVVRDDVTSIDTVTICPGDTAIIHGNPETQPGPYVHNSSTVNGCDSMVTTVLAFKVCNNPPPPEPPVPVDIFIPNVFTPNGEPGNEVYTIKLQGVTLVSFEVYNRWGLLMHSSTEKAEWDGYTSSAKEASDGTYYFILKYAEGQEQVIKKGTITLLR